MLLMERVGEPFSPSGLGCVCHLLQVQFTQKLAVFQSSIINFKCLEGQQGSSKIRKLEQLE